MSKICYIVGAGDHFESDIFNPEADDLVIAADGGYNFLKDNNIRTDIIIGDFDSVNITHDYFSDIPDSQIIKLNPIKDKTDTLSAIDKGIDEGYSTFYIYGGTGGRTEHTIANIQALSMLSEKNMRGYILGKNEIMTVIHNTDIRFRKDSKGYISVFSLTDTSKNVNETGLKYTLNNYTMSSSYPIGVSNEFEGNEGYISVGDGTLLIIYPKGTHVI